MLSNCLKLYTSNLPVIVLLCKTQVLNDKLVLVIQQDTYAKTPYTTYLTTGAETFRKAINNPTTDQKNNTLRSKNTDKLSDVSLSLLPHNLLTFFTQTKKEEHIDYTEEAQKCIEGLYKLQALAKTIYNREDTLKHYLV